MDTAEGDFVSGFQIGVELSTADAEITSVDQGADLIAVMDPDPVEFFGVEIIPGGQAVSVGAVPEITPDGDPPVFRTFDECQEDLEVMILNIAPKVQAPVAVEASFANALGTPPKDIGIDVDGETKIPTLGAAATFNFACEVGPAEPFVRGDANQDNVINVSDAVAIAKAVFSLGSKLSLIQGCRDSADVNDDGAVDTTDALYLLTFLFESGTAIPAPNTCGNDPTPDDLDCPTYSICAQ
jgi:hypothetical protein